MQAIRNLEYQQCRICYDSTSNLQPLTSSIEPSPLVADKTYAQVLLEVCNINVMHDKPIGRWPQFICHGCSRKLKLAYDFIQHTLKINKLLQSIADLLQVTSESNFIEKPALDIPLEIKTEKDDDVRSPSIERKFQYSPVEVDVTKAVLGFQTNELYNNISSTNNTLKEYKTNKKIDDEQNDNESIKEILVPSPIEFDSDDVIIKHDLEKFHRKIISDMDSTNQSDDSDIEFFDDNLLCAPEAKISNISTTDVVCKECNETFASTWELNRHKNICHTTEENKTHCAICSQNFARPYNYRRHMKNVHKRKKQQQTKQNRKIIQHLNCTQKINTNQFEDLTCNICKKKFLSHQRLLRHKRYSHLPEEEKITCNICGHKFSRPDNYQSHVKRMHKTNGIPPPTDIHLIRYSCSKCNSSYSRRSLLSKHESDVHGFK